MKKKSEGRNSDNGKREEILQKAGAYSAVFFMAFFVALVSASAFTPVDRSEAATTEVNLDSAGYNLQVSSAGTVSMDLTATADGVVAIEKDTLNVRTNSKGYKVYISMNGNNQTLANATAGSSFGPVNGTAASPVALQNNQWGWARTVANTETNTVLKGYGFSATYCTGSDGLCYANGATTSTTPGSVNEGNLFAAVPVSGNSELVAASTAPASGGGDNHNVYFGVRATTALPSGTYSGTVLYTAVAEASNSEAGNASISPVSTQTQKSVQTMTITTSLYASEVPATNEVNVTVGGETCVVTNVAKVAANNDAINITCITPNDLIWGEYDVVATISKYDRIYTLPNAYAVYIPWATMVAAADNTYSLQQFTNRACKEVAAPAAYTGSIDSGDYQAVRDVPEVVLKDDRDNSQGYRVRKLADGNCWMMDNLRLELSTGDPLDSETSDINFNMDSGVGAKYGKDYNWGDVSAYGRTTTPRVISNDLVGTTDPLGSYDTNSDGTVEWTPFADTQKGTAVGGENPDPDPIRYGYNISWASPYKDKNGTKADSGTDVAATYRHFGMDGKTPETEAATYKVNNNQWAEYARSYSNNGSGQTGTGNGVGNNQVNDGDGNAQNYGNYYNLYAASAGSVTYKMTSGDGMNSVCPRNWILPRNDGDKSWYNLLYTKYGMTVTGNGSSGPEKAAAIAIENTALKKKPFSIIQAGYYYWANGSLNGRGSNALYWSSHPYSQTHANHLYFYSTQSFYPHNGDYKIVGFTVRCVAR